VQRSSCKRDVTVTNCTLSLLMLALLGWSATAVAQAPVGSAFTYQGRLNASGGPASGSHDFEFALYDADTGGNQVGTTVSLTSNVTGGLFSAPLDFGVGTFSGEKRWLETWVRTSGGGAFTPLLPRSEVTPAPHAQYADSASTAISADSAALAEAARTLSRQYLVSTRAYYTQPLAAFETHTGKNVWQSFTATAGGTLAKVVGTVNVLNSAPITLRVRSGEGTGGTLLHTQVITSWIEAGNTITGGPQLTQGSVYTIELSCDNNLEVQKGHPYPGGTSNSGDDFSFDVRVENPEEQILVSAPSETQLYVNAKVGIGTNNPEAALHIGGTAGIDGIKFPNGTTQTTAFTGTATHAATADNATNASNAAHATTAGSATNATNAATATNADNADDADKLDGIDSAGFALAGHTHDNVALAQSARSLSAVVSTEQVSAEQNLSNNTTAGTTFWQSFTSTKSGPVSLISVPVELVFAENNLTFHLYEGEGTAGTLLYQGGASYFQLGSSFQTNAGGVSLTSGQKYTLFFTTGGVITWDYAAPDAYPGGRNDTNNGDCRFKVSVLASSEKTIVSAPNSNTVQVDAALQVTGSAQVASNLTVDGSTLAIDAANNRVGVGNATPENPLHVTGSFDGVGLSSHVALIENTNTGTGSDVLALKVGNTANPGGGQNFVTFLKGDNTAVGEIDGNANGGVSYKTAAADFAEELPQLDPAEQIEAGDVVGVFGGKVSRRTEGADWVMAVSTAAAFVGNSRAGEEAGREQVAFMGQVPVRVRGAVQAGDYIVASGLQDGTAVAVDAAAIQPEQGRLIIGRAWEASNSAEVKMINTVIGLPETASTSAALAKQVEELAQRNQQLEGANHELEARLERIEKLMEARGAAR